MLVFAAIATAVGWPATRAQRAAPSPRDTRTAAQRKIDPRLVSEINRRRGQPGPKPPAPAAVVNIDRHGRALVDVRAELTRPLQDKIAALGGMIVSTSARYQSIIARVPILELERLAGDATVRAIEIAKYK